MLLESRVRGLALFNLGIDRKLRGCDLVALRVDAKDQGNADLPAHQELARRAVAPRALQAGVDREYLGIEVDDTLEISGQTEI
jgi:hypothetical protein